MPTSILNNQKLVMILIVFISMTEKKRRKIGINTLHLVSHNFQK